MSDLATLILAVLNDAHCTTREADIRRIVEEDIRMNRNGAIGSSAMLAIAAKLRHSVATASNDDYSKPQTDKRERHRERIETMQEAAEAFEMLAQGAVTQPAADRGTP